MKILIIDRDPQSSESLRGGLEAVGHMVETAAAKNDGMALLEKSAYDVVFMDPAPMTDMRPLVLGVRRAVRSYPYIAAMATEENIAAMAGSGANDVLPKPLDGAKVAHLLDGAQRLNSLVKQMGDESEDFRSAGGVIAKSAINQLFLAALDRADRYGEKSFLVFISIDNYKDLVMREGAYTIEYATAKLSQNLVRLRRQSDIIGQTGKGEYCLMLQRPQYETEPLEAANRFAEAMGQMNDICATPTAEITIAVRLVEIPSGALRIEHIIPRRAQ